MNLALRASSATRLNSRASGEAVPLEAPKGSLILLHGRLPHRSSANISDKSRYAYTLHTVDASAHYPADNWLQRRDDLPLRTFGEGMNSA